MKIKQYIIEEIKRRGGMIPFDEFVTHALYAPGLGYYCSKNQVIGERGDFITAPELSPLFAKTIANFVELQLKNESLDTLIEFGAGTGRLALELLKQLTLKEALPQKYYIIDVSGSLKESQAQLFQQEAPELMSIVEWCSSLPSEPLKGFVLANEVLDAMPFKRFCQTNEGVFEIAVKEQDGELKETLIPQSETLEKNLTGLELDNLVDYQSEINCYVAPWLRSIYDCLAKGTLLLIDYGFPQKEYYHPSRASGTMMCHFAHKAHTNPYINLGEQDITAHVDFTHVAKSAMSCGMDILGYTNQASFLLANGILDYVNQDDEKQRVIDNQAVKKLTLPHEMGELFKVMALGKNVEPLTEQRFSLFDHRVKL